MYLSRHNAALKILFFELLKDFDLIMGVLKIHPGTHLCNPNHSTRMTKRYCTGMYQYMLILPSFSRANKTDVTVFDKVNKKVMLVETTD